MNVLRSPLAFSLHQVVKVLLEALFVIDVSATGNDWATVELPGDVVIAAIDHGCRSRRSRCGDSHHGGLLDADANDENGIGRLTNRLFFLAQHALVPKMKKAG